MIKSTYTLKLFEYGLKYGKYETSTNSLLFNRLRNYLFRFVTKKDVSKIFCYETTNKPKENFYRLTLPREVKDDKTLVLQSIKDYKKVDNFFNGFIMCPLTSAFILSIFLSFYNVNSVLIMASVSTSFYSLVKINKLVGYHNVIVDSIFLKSCGKYIVINTLTRSFEVNVLKVRKMRMTEIYFFKKFFDHLEEEFIPIVVDYEVFLIPKSLDYVDKEILFAITHSCYVENN